MTLFKTPLQSYQTSFYQGKYFGPQQRLIKEVCFNIKISSHKMIDGVPSFLLPPGDVIMWSFLMTHSWFHVYVFYAFLCIFFAFYVFFIHLMHCVCILCILRTQLQTELHCTTAHYLVLWGLGWEDVADALWLAKLYCFKVDLFLYTPGCVNLNCII